MKSTSRGVGVTSCPACQLIVISGSFTAQHAFTIEQRESKFDANSDCVVLGRWFSWDGRFLETVVFLRRQRMRCSPTR